MRIDKQSYYLDIARTVLKRSTCLRRQYGSVIVQHDEIISTGYNGSPRGYTNCCDVGECWRIQHNIPHGEQYSKCLSVHAEMNAIISASRSDMIDSTLYLVGYDLQEQKEIVAIPCEICKKMIINAGIKKIINIEGELKCENM